MVLLSILRIVWALLALAIVVLVLLHAPKGDGLAAIGGSAQLFSSQKSAEANLDRVTWGAAIVFLLLSVFLSSSLASQLAGSSTTTGNPSAPPAKTQPAPASRPIPSAPPVPVPQKK